MHLFAVLASLLALGSAVVVPRQDINRSCRFGLTSVGFVDGTVKKDTIGELLLGGAFAEGVFFLDPVTHILNDGVGKNCFFGKLDEQFQCFQAGTNITAYFGFTYTPQPDDDGVYLTYDVGVYDFLACPSLMPSTEPTYEIYSRNKRDKTGCQPVSLLRQNEIEAVPGACDVNVP